MLGALSVFLVALWFVVRYRKRPGESSTPHIVARPGVEVATGALLLTLFIVWWVIGFRQYVTLATPPEKGIETYVTAKQWMWKFAHANGRSSVGILVAPRGKTVRLLITSRDVIHSFYVPAFRLKQDAVPGRYTSTWFRATRTGSFPIYCAEYCGVGHSRMWARVVVVEPEDYERWLDGEVPKAVAEASAEVSYAVSVTGGEGESLAARGREAAAKHGCFACHTIDGQRHVGPSFVALFGSSVTLESGERVIADESYLTESMMDPASKVVRGFAPVMPTFRGRLSQPDAAGIVEFIKSLKNERPQPAVPLPRVEATPDTKTPTAPAAATAERGAP